MGMISHRWVRPSGVVFTPIYFPQRLRCCSAPRPWLWTSTTSCPASGFSVAWKSCPTSWTERSVRTLSLTPELLARLNERRKAAVFAGPDNWIFASSIRGGKLPYSYTFICLELHKAAKAGTSVRIRSGTPTAHGLTPWVHRSRSSKS